MCKFPAGPIVGLRERTTSISHRKGGNGEGESGIEGLGVCHVCVCFLVSVAFVKSLCRHFFFYLFTGSLLLSGA